MCFEENCGKNLSILRHEHERTVDVTFKNININRVNTARGYEKHELSSADFPMTE